MHFLSYFILTLKNSKIPEDHMSSEIPCLPLSVSQVYWEAQSPQCK